MTVPDSQGRLLVACAAAYSAAAALVAGTGILAWGVSWPDVRVTAICVGGFFLAAGFALVAHRGRGVWRLVAGLYFLLGAAALIALFRSSLPIRPYGDGNSINDLVRAGIAYPRWLLPTALVGWFYNGIWTRQLPGFEHATTARGKAVIVSAIWGGTVFPAAYLCLGLLPNPQ